MVSLGRAKFPCGASLALLPNLAFSFVFNPHTDALLYGSKLREADAIWSPH